MQLRTNPFKIEITSGQDSISYTDRSFGEIGKDILAIKLALNVIQDLNGTIQIHPDFVSNQNRSIPLDPNGWFDCKTGNPISIEQAATFDSKLESALTNYQTQNQFLILCYLFEKYGVRNIIDASGSDYIAFLVEDQVKYDRSILQQLDAIDLLWKSELGRVGEATLAIMHGWLPHTTISNKGYVHSGIEIAARDKIHDILPLVLVSHFQSGHFGQTESDLAEAGYVPGSLKYDDRDALLRYLEIVPDTQKWINESMLARFRYGSLEYHVLRENNSPLYSATVITIQNYNNRSEISRTEEESVTEDLRRVFFPDPFSTTETFYINPEKTGFYFETDFVLSSEGPLPTNTEEEIMALEEEALSQVLQTMEKKDAWFVPITDEFSVTTWFGTDDPPAPMHSGFYPQSETPDIKKYINRFVEIREKIKTTQEELEALPASSSDIGEQARRGILEQKLRELQNQLGEEISLEEKKNSFWVVGTEKAINRLTTEETSTNISHWRSIDNFGNQPPLIKFVEYKVPSMRPGQKFRAFMELSSRKIDLITLGPPAPETEEAVTSTGSQPPTTNVPEICADESVQGSIRTMEEYRAHAKRNRRQIVRKLREHLQDDEKMRGSPTIDLGTFGPFDINNALKSILGFDINGASDEEYTRMVLTKLGDVGTAALQGMDIMDTDVEYFNNTANESNKELTKSDANGNKRIDGIEITLEDFEKRIETILKDLQESEGIISAEGISFMPGSKFKASQESTLLKQFSTEFKDLALMNVEKIYGATVAKYMESNPAKTQIFLTFAVVEPKGTSKRFGPKIGKSITEFSFVLPSDVKIGGKTWWHAEKSDAFPGAVNFLEPGGPVTKESQKLISGSKVLSRPRTVNYISNIKEMTGLLTDRPGEIISFFDDGRGACKDIGINLEKRQAAAYIAKFTTGVKVKAPPGDKSGSAWAKMKKEVFVDPAKQWLDTGLKNWENSWNDSFDADAALKAMGELCTLEDLYKEFFDKLDLASLICDYLKCIRLPNFNIKVPSFYLPPFPRIPILGWYGAMIKFLRDNIKQILTRLACTFVRAIIDKLSIPFCEEQLRNFIAAGSLSGSPVVDQALAAALLDTGIADERKEEAKNFFDDVANITTGQELCRLLSGKPLDNASMLMVQRLVQKNNLEGDFSSEEDILNYFDLLGTMLPGDICSELGKSNELPVAKDCVEIADYLSDIRNRLQTGDSTLTDEEIDKVVQMAKEEMDRKKDSLRALSGNNLGSLIPEAYRPGDSSAIISDYPDFLKEELQNTVQDSFSSARISYVDALDNYVPSMSMPLPSQPKAGQLTYSDIQSLKFEAALTQMAMYAASLETSGPTASQFAERYLPGISEKTPEEMNEIIKAGRSINKKAEKLAELIREHKGFFEYSSDAEKDHLWVDGANRDLHKVNPAADERDYTSDRSGYGYEFGSVREGYLTENYGNVLDKAGFVFEYLSSLRAQSDTIKLKQIDQPIEATLMPGERQSYDDEEPEPYQLDQSLKDQLEAQYQEDWGIEINLTGLRGAIKNEIIQKIFFGVSTNPNGITGANGLLSYAIKAERDDVNRSTVGALEDITRGIADRTFSERDVVINFFNYIRDMAGHYVAMIETEPQWVASKGSIFELGYRHIYTTARQACLAEAQRTNDRSWVQNILVPVLENLGNEQPETETIYGWPYLGFRRYYYRMKDIWDKSYGDELTNAILKRADQESHSDDTAEANFVKTRYTDVEDTLRDLDALIREYTKKNEMPRHDANPDTNNAYQKGPTEEDFINNFLIPESETAVSYYSHFRSLEYLDWLVKQTHENRDVVNALVKNIKVPVKVMWHNAMLLYADFKQQRVPMEIGEGEHAVFTKSKVLHPDNPQLSSFVAAMPRAFNSYMDYMIDTPPRWEIWVHDTDDDYGTKLVRHGGAYYGVFNPTKNKAPNRAGAGQVQTAKTVDYETYYDSINDPDKKESFVLTASPINWRNSYIGELGMRTFVHDAWMNEDNYEEQIEALKSAISDYQIEFISQNSENLQNSLQSIRAVNYLVGKLEERGGKTVFQGPIDTVEKSYAYHFVNAMREELLQATYEGSDNPFRLARQAALDESIFITYSGEQYGDSARQQQFALPLIACSLTGPIDTGEDPILKTFEVLAEITDAVTNNMTTNGDTDNTPTSYDKAFPGDNGYYRKHLITMDTLSGEAANEIIKCILNKRQNHPGLMRLVQRRLDELSGIVIEGVRNRSIEVTPRHLVLLERVMKSKTIVNFPYRDITEFALEFGLYKPKVKFQELSAANELERYNITISSDFHLHQASSEFEDKVFKFCERLPSSLVRSNSPDETYLQPGHTTSKYFSKREAFASMVVSSIRQSTRPGGLSVPQALNVKKQIYENGFVKTQRGIMKYLEGSLKDSRLFDLDYATTLDERISAKPSYNVVTECVTNRYGLVEASVLSFNKVILEESYMEIMKETAKPENNFFNRDFDDPTPLDKALQSISIKAYVRTCLIDTMLKGGLAYSVWDIEPVVSQPLFIEYVLEHIKLELNNNRFYKDIWREAIQGAVGITNPNIALRKLVEREALKLPDYSKQVFNFDKKNVDFFDWYFSEKVPTRDLLTDADYFSNLGDSEGESSRPIAFRDLDSDNFYIEDYVKVSGAILNQELLSAAEAGYQRVLEEEFPFEQRYVDTRYKQALYGFDLRGGYDGVIYIPTWAFDMMIEMLSRGLGGVEYNSVISSSEFFHGARLVCRFDDHQTVSAIASIPGIYEDSFVQKSFLQARYMQDNILDGNPTVVLDRFRDQNTNNIFKIVASVPIVFEEREINLETCTSAFSGQPSTGLYYQRDYIVGRLKQKEQFKNIFEHMFPIRRYMTMASLFSTAVLSGYNGMPTLFAAVKSAIAFMGKVVATPPTVRSTLIPLSPEEFRNAMNSNWPQDANSAECFDFPFPSKEFFEKFLKDLWKLITQLPSILFRGVASVIDPAYKEMKMHYLNCDIKHLTMDGLKAETLGDSTHNGLYLPTGEHSQNNGLYAPLLFTGGIDMLGSIAHLLAFNPKPLGITVAKMISYAFSGNLPFIDPSMAFSIPCKGINESLWEGEKYDVGHFGRYGHPLSPFTILALCTPELESDKKTKRPNCIEKPLEEFDECDEE